MTPPSADLDKVMEELLHHRTEVAIQRDERAFRRRICVCVEKSDFEGSE